MLDMILDNINHMLNGQPDKELKYLAALKEDQGRWTKYEQLVPKLKERIRKANQIEKDATQLNKLREMKVIYEDVILQTSNYLSQHDRAKKYEHYINNSNKIDNIAVRASLDNLAYQGSELGKSMEFLRKIQQNFKSHISIDLDNSISFNLRNIETYLFLTKVQAQENILNLGEINSISMLINQITSKIEHNSPLDGFKEVLDLYIKREEIKQPLNYLLELLDKNNINLVSHKDQQKIVKQINAILEIKQEEKELTEGLQEIKKRVSHSEEIMFQHFQKEIYNQGKMKVMGEIITLVSIFTSGPLKKSFTRLDEKYLAQLKDNFHCKIEETKEALVPRSNHQQGKMVDLLKKDMETLSKRHELLQLSESALNEHLLETKDKIKQLKAQYSAFFTSLKRQILKLKSIKNQIYTQIQEHRHFIEDQMISNSHELQQKINEEVEKMRKILCAEKAREIQKAEERRRMEKNKLTKQYDQVFYQLESLKEKYYTEIVAKLCKSRLDLSMSRMDDVETKDRAVGNSFMLLENSFANEESIGVGPDRDEEEGETSEQLMAQFNKHFQDQIEKIKKKNGEQEEVISILNKENERTSEQLKEQSARRQQLANELLKNQKIISQRQTQITYLLQNIKKLKAANLDYESTVKKLNQTAKTSYPQSTTRTPQLSSTNGSVPLFIPYHKILFQGEVFGEDSHPKETLIKHITNYMRSPIIKTHLLHKFDPNNKANFHLYIDNKKHLACVVKTKNVIIAGFYPGQLKEGVIMNEGGMLVSVTNDQSYQLMEKKSDSKINYRGMTYDPYYAIFGNAEMRVRSGEKRVFCNFGIQNRYFDYTNKPRNIEAFLNDQNREVEFQYCEFYQLIFQQFYSQSDPLRKY